MDFKRVELNFKNSNELYKLKESLKLDNTELGRIFWLPKFEKFLLMDSQISSKNGFDYYGNIGFFNYFINKVENFENKTSKLNIEQEDADFNQLLVLNFLQDWNKMIKDFQMRSTYFYYDMFLYSS